MSTTQETTIWCDGEGCGIWEWAGPFGAREGRKRLRTKGWTHRKGKDYCPTCSAVENTKISSSRRTGA